MPYAETRQVGVKFASIAGLIYGFRTNIQESSSTALGHVAVVTGGVYNPGVIFGINTPKPPKAKKFFGTGTRRFEASFIDYASIAAARSDGWVLSAGKRSRGRSTPFSKLVYVDYRIIDEIVASAGVAPRAAVTIKYGWRMPGYQYAEIDAATRAALGIEDVTADDLPTTVFGANSAKPPRASKRAIVAGNPAIITTFVASNKIDTLPAEWSAV